MKILLSSHAHIAHGSGLALLKQELPDAKLVAIDQNAEELERGGKNDFAFGDRQAFAPARVDQRISDGTFVELGGTVVTALLTPGHTKACTTWTATIPEDGKSYHVVWACSVSTPGYQLVGNGNYPQIADDVRSTLRKLGQLPCDVLLAPHGSAFGLSKKRALREAGGPNPFIDPAELSAFVRTASENFEQQLRAQQLEGGQPPSE